MRALNFLLSLLLLSGPTVSAAQNDTTLPPGVQVIVNGHNLPSDSYALLVQEVGSDTPLLSVNASQPMNPASTIKTVTTLAALEQLGPTYTWNTDVYALGEIDDGTLQGDLLIRGGGDPFLVEEHMRSMLKAVQRRGIRHITGDLILDGSAFEPSVSTDTAIDNQADRAYNVTPHALLSNFQVVNYYFRPHANGRDVVIYADPPLPNLKIDNRLRLRDGVCRGFQRGISYSANRSTNTAIFSGQFPSGCTEYALARAALNHEEYFYGIFQYLWKELGGSFEGNWSNGSAPSNTPPLLSWQSPPLAEIIRSINKFSNNVMTRHLLLTLGLEREGAPASLTKGINAIQAYLDHIGVDHQALHMVNGSGLSRDTKLSAEMLASILQRGGQISFTPEYVASLPLSGLDGTMRSRLRGPATIGNMHVKTGSLDDVAGIAGYVRANSGKRYVVVALLNNSQADAGPGQELGDALLQWVQQQ